MDNTINEQNTKQAPAKGLDGKIITIIVLAIIAAVMSYLALRQKPVAEQKQPTANNTTQPPKTQPAEQPAPQQQPQSKVYSNSEYGFNFTLPNSWSGYTTKVSTSPWDTSNPSGSQVYSIAFYPTDPATGEPYDSTKSVFSVQAAPIGIWSADYMPGGDGSPVGIFLGKNSSYFFGYRDQQDSYGKNPNAIVQDGRSALVSTFKTVAAVATPSWKDTVYNQFKSLSDWQTQENLAGWQTIDVTPSQLAKYGTGKIFLLSKSFNQNGCQSDCAAEGKAEDSLIADTKTVLSQNGWKLISSPSEPGFYTEYLYASDGHPLILKTGTRDAVTGGMYVAIQFQY